MAAPFSFEGEEGEEPIKMSGLELISVVLHTTKDDNIKKACLEVGFLNRKMARNAHSFVGIAHCSEAAVKYISRTFGRNAFIFIILLQHSLLSLSNSHSGFDQHGQARTTW